MKTKKIIALIISIIILIGIGLLIWYFNNNKLNTSNNANKENNIYAENSSKSQEKVDISEGTDGLIFIKGGTYNMGSPETEAQREDDEKQHTVTVNDFYIGKYEVTQKEYQEIMGENPSNFSGDNLPVENITWYEAIEYCNKLSEKEGLKPVYTINGTNVSWDKSSNGYRLPTEAEWEYAARAGTTTVFNTENSISADEANFYGHYPYLIEENYFTQENLDTKPGEYRQTTTPVGSFSPNKWGLYDTHGNVREWCFDYYGEYDTQNTDNPSGVTTGTLKVNRGGSWNDYAKHMRSAYRSSLAPEQRMNNTGFRIVRNSEGTENTGTVESSNREIQTSQNGKSLIVYFSWSGNTENAAKMIQEKTGADIFELELVNPYSEDYNTVLDQAQKDLNSNARPKLKNKVEDISQYDRVMIGYPNWWATIPMPVATFLDEYDLSGKTIIPFCSHGGGEFGQSISDISKIEPNAIIGTGLSIHYSGGSSLSKDIDNWLSENGIK